MTKLWDGRFSKPVAPEMDDFHSSLRFDRRLYRQDIRGSIAHARMLGRQGIISQEEAAQIITALEEILCDIEEGRLEFSPEVEDIHMQVELWLTARIGETGKKLHTARSRNDQVALDVRMYLKEEIIAISELLRQLIATLLDLAANHLTTIMPGYTHLQRAQPVTLAHHLMAYVQMFFRDLERLRDCYRRTDVLPLGAGALAGTTFPIDPAQVAAELNFTAIAENSLDAVSDRDFVVEFAAAAALIMVHLSRFCEEIILWSTAEFAFIRLDDAYSTGSSMMPQKKNPDAAELIRGKSGRVFGSLLGLLTMLKGLPLAYNKDLQEDKEALFDIIDTVKGCLRVFIPMLATMEINRKRMIEAARGGFTNATDLADYLVRLGIPFREAHRLVGRAVAYAEKEGKNLEELSREELEELLPQIIPLINDKEIYESLAIEHAVARRRVLGGPAPEAVKAAINRARARLAEEGWSSQC